MTTRPRASLGRVLEDLGTTLLDLVCGSPDDTRTLDAVVIQDPLDEPVSPRNAIVLGVGVHGTEEIATLLRDLGERDAAALVVRSPVELDPALTSAAEKSGVALLTLTRGASWAQFAAMLRSMIAEDDVATTESETLGGLPSGDLFALANAIATMIDAPITIEDRNTRVLAFSGRQDEADPSRVETILGRSVPSRFAQIIKDRGIFEDLYASSEPLFFQPMPGPDHEVKLPRVALAVRAGDEILGSIWVAVRSPLSPERSQALKDAAKLVALHLLRIRAGDVAERRLRADLVATVLGSGPDAADALSRLGLAGHSCVVLALAPTETAAEADQPAARAQLVIEEQRVADALALHLGAVYPRAAVALVGDVAYAIVGVRPNAREADERVAQIAAEFVERIGSGDRLLVGVGGVASDVAAVARSRADADRALRVLRLGRTGHRVARFKEVHVDSLMLEVADLCASRGEVVEGAVARLAAYDAKRRSHLVDTLGAWLDWFGDVIAASAAVYTHPNTFRYRLRRVAEVGGIDLNDPDQRFAVMVELFLFRLAGSGRGDEH